MKSSLSRQNGAGTTAGAGASPVFSSKQKHKRFKQLQSLDRRISKIQKRQFLVKMFNKKLYLTNIEKVIKLDTKRKEVRLGNLTKTEM